MKATFSTDRLRWPCSLAAARRHDQIDQFVGAGDRRAANCRADRSSSMLRPQRSGRQSSLRAKSRGTTVAGIEPSGIILEKLMTQTPAALEATCGPHKEGRRIRVLLGTAEQGAGTLVSEQRFIVDGENECRILQTPDVVEDARRSLNELKTEVETAVAQR